MEREREREREWEKKVNYTTLRLTLFCTYIIEVLYIFFFLYANSKILRHVGKYIKENLTQYIKRHRKPIYYVF